MMSDQEQQESPSTAGNSTKEPNHDAEIEPRLSYQHFGSDVPNILSRDSATALCVSDKLLALGTASGSVYLLDYEGNKVKNYQEHNAPITDLSFDADAETLASSSSDGYVVIYGLYSGQVQRISCRAPVSTLALDPRHAHRKTKEFIYGTVSGELLLSSKGWLGNTETVLFKGKGRIHSARMAGTMLAWSTDTGIRVYDTSNHSRVGKIDRPSQSGCQSTGLTTESSSSCRLVWIGDKELVVGWGRTILCYRIMIVNNTSTNSSLPSPGAPPTPPLTPGINNTNTNTPNTSKFKLQLDTKFDISDDDDDDDDNDAADDEGASIVGVAPFGRQLVVLLRSSSSSSSSPEEEETKSKIRLQVFDREGGKKLFSDTINLQNVTSMAAFYSLHDVIASNGGGSALTTTNNQQQQYKWWSDGSEPLYYIVSPKDIIIGRPLNATDRIQWLADRHRYSEALAVAETEPSIKQPAKLALGEQYLHYLLLEKQQYSEAAVLCPCVLGNDGAAWERWVYTFGQAAQLPVLAPYLPISQPTLTPSAYNMALSACLLAPDEQQVLKQLVTTWPRDIYDPSELLDKITTRMGNNNTLKHVAASLNAHLGRPEAALQLLLEVRASSTFEYIKINALESIVATMAAQLIELDEVKATSLLVENAEGAAPVHVVASLQQKIDNNSSNKEENKKWSLRLYHYLDWLWQRDPTAAAPFAEQHVALCARFESAKLLHFLTSSSSYPLDAALQVCESHGLIQESVYVLGRMGSADAALKLIIENLRDVESAVAFVQESRDDELWEQLISLTLGDAVLAGDMLDHSAGEVDPLRLVSAIPEKLKIENLRDRLVRVIQQFKNVMSLQSGCNAVLRSDCLQLGEELYSQLRRALDRLHLLRPGGSWMLYTSAHMTVLNNVQLKEEENGDGMIEKGPPKEIFLNSTVSMDEGGEQFIKHQKVCMKIVDEKAAKIERRKMLSAASPSPSVHSSPSKFLPPKHRG